MFAPSLIVLIDKAAACHVEIKRLNFFEFASLVSSTVAEFASCNCIDYNTAIFILSKLDRVWYSYRRNTDWGNVIESLYLKSEINALFFIIFYFEDSVDSIPTL